MAGKTPFTFTAVSYVTNRSGGGETYCRKKIVFEQVCVPEGVYQFKAIKCTAFLPQAGQAEYDRKMMEHAGTVLSNYLLGPEWKGMKTNRAK